MKEKKKIMLIIFLITIIFNICVFAAVVTTTKRVLVGDADKNNIVDKKDAVMILDKITEEKLNQTTTTEIPLIADTNLDNEINLIDVVDIARYDKAKNEWINSEWITKLEKDIEFGVTQNITIDFSKTNTAKIDVSGKNYGKVLFKSEDTKIVEVDQEGNIIVKNIGETRVIVTESRGGISRTCSIIVEISPTSIKLDKSNIILDLSGTKKAALKATVEPLGSGEHKLTWTSSNENVAVVDQVGNITAKNNGNATISVRTENGKSDTCEVKVQTSPTGIKLDKSNITLDLSGNKTATLNATVEPSTANINNELTWVSEDESIATVDQQGNIIAKKNGNVIIGAITQNGKVNTCEVKVQTSPTGITLDKKNVTLDLSKAKTATLKATIEPLTVDVNNNLVWGCSDKSIVTVDQQGNITAKSNGTATISVVTDNGKGDTCNVNVQTSPTGIVLDKKNVTLDLSGTKTTTLKATIEPSTANVNTQIEWKSSDTAVATIDSNGKITAKGNGTTIISAMTGNNLENICEVKVQTSPTSIKINTPNTTLVKETKTLKLDTTIEPSTANTKITWTSSDENIATVDSNGKVTGVEFGKVTITASSNGKKATQELTIVDESYIDIENLVLGTLVSKATTESKSPMQSFALTFNGKIEKNNIEQIYISQESESTAKKPTRMNVSKMSYDGSRTIKFDNTTIISEINHGDSLEYYKGKILTLFTNTDEDNWAKRKILQLDYEKIISYEYNNSYENAKWHTIADIKSSILEDNELGNPTAHYVTVATDEVNNLILLRRGTKKNQFYDVFSVKNITKEGKIEKVKMCEINVERKEGYTFQGMDIEGNYIYIYECSKDAANATFKSNEFGDSYITICDLKGNIILDRYNVEKNLAKKDGEIRNLVFKNDIKNNENFISYEPEGIKVYNGVLYIGNSLKITGETKAKHNIFYFKEDN